MSAREEILERLRKNTRETYDFPDLSGLNPITCPDPVAEFIKKTTTTAGAKLIEMEESDNLNELIRKAYPEAKVLASNLPGIEADLSKI